MSIVTSSTLTGKCPACKSDGVVLKDVQGLLVCEKCSQKRFSAKVRKKIQEAYEKQEQRKVHEAWKRRIEVLKLGLNYYEEQKLKEALKVFNEYLGIMEANHKVGAGGLRADDFVRKKQEQELLVVAGVYWDIAKIFDNIKGKQAEMKHAMNKFVEFSVNRPHLILSSEAIRKYLASGLCRHPEDFKSAHTVLRSHLTKCFIMTAVYGDNSRQVIKLRIFRDSILSKSFLGRTFISLYYAMGPKVSRTLIYNPRLQKCVKKIFDQII